MHRLSQIPASHVNYVPEKNRSPDQLEKVPPIFAGKKGVTPLNQPSEFQIYRFKKDGQILKDESGRDKFSLYPATAEHMAEAMGAKAVRV